jgi:hypothetical protein
MIQPDVHRGFSPRGFSSGSRACHQQARLVPTRPVSAVPGPAGGSSRRTTHKSVSRLTSQARPGHSIDRRTHRWSQWTCDQRTPTISLPVMGAPRRGRAVSLYAAGPKAARGNVVSARHIDNIPGVVTKHDHCGVDRARNVDGDLAALGLLSREARDVQAGRVPPSRLSARNDPRDSRRRGLAAPTAKTELATPEVP